MWKKLCIWYFEIGLLGSAVALAEERKIIKCNGVLSNILVIFIFFFFMYRLVPLLRSAIEEGRKKKKINQIRIQEQKNLEMQLLNKFMTNFDNSLLNKDFDNANKLLLETKDLLVKYNFLTKYENDYKEAYLKQNGYTINDLDMVNDYISGIYCIENTITSKKYIGQAVDIKQRWKQHLNCSDKRDLYKDMKLYGTMNFKFYILEECNPRLLDEKEVYYIELYDTYKNGYNNNRGNINKVKAIQKYELSA